MSDNEYGSDNEVVNPKAHRLLVDNVARLHNAKQARIATRTEPAIKRSEFHLAKTASTATAPVKRDTKVNTSDLIDVLDKTNKHVTIGQTLKKVEKKKKLLKKPLEKPQAERLKRAIGYEKAKEQLLRWDAIVAKNKSTDHLTFPLNQEINEIEFKDSYQVPSEFRIKSDMMREMEAIEPEVFQIGKPQVPNDDEVREKLTRAEMIERNRELRRLRMKEAQQSAKAYRQNKIKSKKYHRILKKEKMRQQIKEFELLQKTDPEAALRKIEQLDRNRVEERANQRHRNTGTWAKNLQVRAKYNKDVRKELADQIAISRELTAKKQIDESDDENGDINALANNEDDPDYDPFNPWLKNETEPENHDEDELLGGYRKYWLDRNKNDEQLKEYRSDGPTKGPRQEVERTKIGLVSCSKQSKQKPSRVNQGWIEEDLDDTLEIVVDQAESIKDGPSRSKGKKLATIDNLDDFFDDAEYVLEEKFTKKANLLQKQLNTLKKKKRRQRKQTNDNDENGIDLTFKPKNKRPKIDEELNAEDANDATAENNGMATVLKTAQNKLTAGKNNASAQNGMKNVENINPDEFAKVQSRHLHTALPDTIYTNDEDGMYEQDDGADAEADAHRLTLAEAFEDDDIVAQFERDQEDEAKKNGPQEIDMSLPGWGSWGGCGINPDKQRAKRRMVLKFPAIEKRKPENEGNLVIIENGDEKLKKHRVSNLPFPFTSVADYEQSIRAPIGNDFVPMTAHKLLTKPAVATKLGTIIDPMNENMLIKPARRAITKTSKKIAQLEVDKF